jgi:hypothetical protein
MPKLLGLPSRLMILDDLGHERVIGYLVTRREVSYHIHARRVMIDSLVNQIIHVPK